jgi:Lrp/AsnC family transcriptional regulator for asnA, asnC and gidA
LTKKRYFCHEITTFSPMELIDTLDKKILSIVMRNARIPSKDVATECGVSRAAIHQRIQRLTDLGVITGSGYNVNPKFLGFSTCTYIGVNLERGAMYREAVPHLLRIPEVVECHYTTGPYTMLIKVYARDNEHLMQLLNDRIQMIPGVTGTETLISLDISINREIPIDLNAKDE